MVPLAAVWTRINIVGVVPRQGARVRPRVRHSASARTSRLPNSSAAHKKPEASWVQLGAPSCAPGAAPGAADGSPGSESAPVGGSGPGRGAAPEEAGGVG